MNGSPYLSPVFTCDEQGRIGTWPLPAESFEPDDAWIYDVPTGPLPLLVEPGPLRDPMMEVER